MSTATPDLKASTDASQPEDEPALVQAGYRFALSLTANRHEAEDLVQQACFKVIARKGRLSSRGYLLTAIRNLFYDTIRRKKLIAFEPIDEMNDSLPDPTPPVFGTKLDLETSLKQLGPQEREVIYLNCVEGYTAAELATMLDKPRSTILNIISRAKSQLQSSNRAMESSPIHKGVPHG